MSHVIHQSLSLLRTSGRSCLPLSRVCYLTEPAPGATAFGFPDPLPPTPAAAWVITFLIKLGIFGTHQQRLIMKDLIIHPRVSLTTTGISTQHPPSHWRGGRGTDTDTTHYTAQGPVRVSNLPHRRLRSSQPPSSCKSKPDDAQKRFV